MNAPSESRLAETTGPWLEGWSLGSAEPPKTDRRADYSPAAPWGEESPDLSFRLASSENSPGAERSIVMTRTHSPHSGRPRGRVLFPDPGGLLGGFRIVSELGRGAFARVYLAEQTDLAGRLVALKVAEALGDEPQALARLQHANIVPIHSVHDDPATGLRLLCMPFYGGANLAQVLERSGTRLPTQASGRSLLDALDDVAGGAASRSGSMFDPSQPAGRNSSGSSIRGAGTPSQNRSLLGRYWARLPWWKKLEGAGPGEHEAHDDHDQPARRFLRSHTYVQAAAWIAARLAEGLDHAHARGILHRDLKPSNVLIAADGTPMLLDFNLAAEAAPVGESEEAARAALGGTLPYMAPEHLDAFNPEGTTSASAVDARSDLYALGLILFEMACGRHPFVEPARGLPLIEIVARMTEDRRRGAPSARSINPAIPPSLDAILAKCLHPDPARRHARAADLAEDLQRFLDDRPNAHAPEPSLRERAEKWWRRHPEVRGAGPILATSVIAMIALSAAGWAIFDYAETASARLRRDRFRDEFARAQLLLNTASGPASHRPAGIAQAQAILDSYGVIRPDSDWTAGPLVRRLPRADRLTLREEVSELLLLLARARVPESGKIAPGPDRRAVLAEAVALLDLAEKIDPWPSAALYESRARFLSAMGETARAKVDRDRAAATPPRSARDFYLRGTTRAALGQYDAAEADLGRAVAMDPRRFWAWFVLGLCHHDRGRYAEAVGDFNACTLLAPDFAWPHLNRGLSLAACGRSDEARASYDQALRISPDFAEALIDRALVCLERDDPEQAERDLARVLQLGRRDASLLAAHAEALSRSGRRDQAERDFAEALRERPDDPRILVARGVSRLGTDPEGAEADLMLALSRAPRDPRAHYGLALLHRRDDPERSLIHADLALDASPAMPDALRLRAVLRGRRGDPRAAIDADALARDPSAHNLYNAACSLALLDASTRSSAHRPLARDLLRRALILGFPLDHATNDPDVASLR